ncbi:hypothetical protein EBS43_02925 [bacterium]|jgi:general secretion pathway protein L|nr:hypothetical protein [bacterium]
MRILGIDFGSSSIKAVEVDSAFGRHEIHDYHEFPLTLESTPERVIQQLIQKLPKLPDRVIAHIPSSQYTFRNLQFPTRDKKVIQSSMAFELEDELPFPSDQCVYDSIIYSQSKAGSEVHVEATLKAHLQNTLELWKKSGIQPDILTTDLWAYSNLFKQSLPSLKEQPDSPVLLIQAGHQKTTLYVHWQGKPQIIREIPWGGWDLTQAIIQKYQIAEEEAEIIKLDRGFIATPGSQASELTPEQNELSETLTQACEPLVRELKLTLLSIRGISRTGAKTIYLTGGTSLLHGFSQWIARQVGIDTQSFHAMSASTHSGVTYSEQTEAKHLLAMSLALCQVGPSKSQCINLRKGEFAKDSASRALNLKAFRQPLIALSAISVSLILSLIVQSQVYSKRLITADEQLERSVRNFFGQLSSSGIRTYLSNPSTLRASINKELNKYREFSKYISPHPKSPMGFLSRISNALPRDIVVDLVQFQAGISPMDSFHKLDSPFTATLTFLVASPQIAEKLIDHLNKQMSSLQRGKLEEVLTAENIKKWKITVSGKPNEESYAQ